MRVKDERASKQTLQARVLIGHPSQAAGTSCHPRLPTAPLGFQAPARALVALPPLVCRSGPSAPGRRGRVRRVRGGATRGQGRPLGGVHHALQSAAPLCRPGRLLLRAFVLPVPMHICMNVYNQNMQPVRLLYVWMFCASAASCAAASLCARGLHGPPPPCRAPFQCAPTSWLARCRLHASSSMHISTHLYSWRQPRRRARWAPDGTAAWTGLQLVRRLAGQSPADLACVAAVASW